MAVPYPDTLPMPVRDGFGGGPSKGIRRSPMDDGQERVRRAWNKQPREFTLTWKLTWDQLKYFDGFVEYDLDGGGGWFEMKLTPNSPTTVQMRFSNPNELTRELDENTGAWMVQGTVEFIAPAPVVPPRTGVLPPWPIALPEPEKDGFRYVQDKAVTRSNIEEGVATLLKRFEERVTTYQLMWLLDEAQKDILEKYYKDDLIDGLAWCSAPFANGLGFTYVRAKFVQPLKIEAFGAAFKATAVMATVDAPKLTKLEYIVGDGMLIQDTITLTEDVRLLYRGKISLSDTVTLTEDLSLYPKVVMVGDSFELLDEATGNTLFRITLDDTFTFIEDVQFANGFIRAFSDTLGTSDSGIVWIQNYFEAGYFGEDYFGESRTF